MVADTKDLAFEKSKYFSKYSVHLIEIRNNFSTKKEHIVVLTSNEFVRTPIQNGENPQAPFLERRKQMATTKIWKVDYRLDHVVNYATDSAKTKNENTEKYRGCKSIMQEIM